MTQEKLLEILNGSTYNADPATADIFAQNVPLIEKLLCDIDPREELCDENGVEPTSLQAFPGREEGSFAKRPISAFDDHFKDLSGAEDLQETFKTMFATLLSELQTWKTARAQRIRARLEQAGLAKVKEAIDGETVSKWTTGISAGLTIVLSLVAGFFGIWKKENGYDQISFFGTLGGAAVALAVWLFAFLYNRKQREKFHIEYGVSLDEAKHNTLTEEEYQKELSAARSLCGNPVHHSKKNMRKARRIYNMLLDRDPTDPNCYVGLLNIDSKNFTVLSGKRIAKYINAVEDWKGENSARLDPEYQKDYKTYTEKIARNEEKGVTAKNIKALHQWMRRENRRRRFVRSLPKWEKVGIYAVLCLPILFSVAVLVADRCLPVKSFSNYTGWLFTVIFALNCLTFLAALVLCFVDVLGNKGPNAEEFGVGISGALAGMAAVLVGFYLGELCIAPKNMDIWDHLKGGLNILLFILFFALRLIVNRRGVYVFRFLIFCLCGAMFGSALTASIIAFVDFSSTDYFEANPDGTYTYIICDNSTEDLEIPSQYRGKPVTSVDRDANISLENLRSVTIPDSVTSIGDSVFYGCSSLESVTFEEDSALTSVGSFTFLGCSSLTSIELPDGVLSLGARVFYNCSALTSVTIPDSITSMGNSVFYGCPIEEATMPGNAISIPTTNLKKVVLTSGEIASRAFADCSTLTDVTIENAVTSIGYRAFYNCTALKNINMGDGIVSIGEDAFYNCGALKKVKGISYVGKWAVDCDSTVSAAELPNDTVGIANGAFRDRKYLVSASLPEGLKFIGEDAFRGTSLSEIALPASLVTIGKNAFYGCTTLNRAVFLNADEWYCEGVYIPSNELSDPMTAARYLTLIFGSYCGKSWERSE